MRRPTILCVSQQETQALEAQNTGYHLLDKIQYGFLFVEKSIRFLQRHGDMNLDGIVNGADIDFMYDGYQSFAAQAVYGGWFDTDQNRVNDHTPVIQNGQLIDYDGDVQHTIRVLTEIEFGDVNGDGIFNSADLTLVFLAGGGV